MVVQCQCDARWSWLVFRPCLSSSTFRSQFFHLNFIDSSQSESLLLLNWLWNAEKSVVRMWDELGGFRFVSFGLVWFGWLATHKLDQKLWCSISYSSNIENVHILQIVVFSHLKMKNFFFKSKMCHLFGCPCWCRFSSMHCWQFVVVGLHYFLFELCIPKHCVASYVFFYSAV